MSNRRNILSNKMLQVFQVNYLEQSYCTGYTFAAQTAAFG
jgi:hypothetical protein